MNRIPLLESEQIGPAVYAIEDLWRIKHLEEVLHRREDLRFVLVNRGLAAGKILEQSRSKIRIQITSETEGQSRDLEAWIGMCRPPTLKKILEHGTASGISKFVFFQSTLTEKSYFQSHLASRSEDILSVLLAGLAQSASFFRLPEVQFLPWAPQSAVVANTALLSQSGDFNFATCGLVKRLLIGPERGFTEGEEERFIRDGAKKVRISASTLRVEYALLYALAQMELLNLC